MSSATLTRDAAAGQLWDAIVIGAGPAGAFAALRLAQAGSATLLVERKAFPRDKVCGGCVSHRAVSLLKNAGLAPAIERLASPKRAMRLYASGRQATIPIPLGLALPRRDLDAMLVGAAIAAGAAFLPETTATVGPVDAGRRVVRLGDSRRDPEICHASVVLLATGLQIAELPEEFSHSQEISPSSRVGLGAIVPLPSASNDSAGIAERDGDSQLHDLESAVIHMAVGRGGYVGLARASSNRLMIAAAVDHGLLAEERQPSAAIARILRSAGRRDWAEMAASVWKTAAWTGTPALTRRLRRPVAERLLAIGDASGYVEPFTGEGIGWALAAGHYAVRPALAARQGWNDRIERDWLDWQEHSMRRRHAFCRLLTAGLRSPRLVGVAVRLLSVAPAVSAPAVWLWDRPLPVVESECEWRE